jgi:hypothetical protein
MRWLTCILLGAILGFTLPQFFGGAGGVWMDSVAEYWTIRPLEGSPGLLFSIPVFLISTIAFRLFFNWHSN